MQRADCITLSASAIPNLYGGLPTASVNNPGLRRGETLAVGGGVQLGVRAPVPLISFVLDDGYATDHTEALPIFQTAGKVANVAIVPAFLGSNASFMTTAQVLELQAAGWEVCSHSKSHTNMAATTDEALLIAELGESKAALEALGLDVRSYVYPFGATNSTYRRLARKYYRSAITVGSTTDHNTQPIPTFNVVRNSLDGASLVQAQAAVDAAVAGNAWLVFMIHTNNVNWPTVKGYLPILLTYIAATTAQIVTVDAALDLYGNLLDTGDPEDGTEFRVSGAGTGDWRGKSQYYESGEVNAATLPDSPLLRPYGQTVSWFGTTGNAGMPTTDRGHLLTVQASKFADRYYSLAQFWLPARSVLVYRRNLDAAGTGWSAWERVDGTIRTQLGTNAEGLTTFPDGISYVEAVTGDGFPVGGLLITIRGFRTGTDAASSDGRDGQLLFKVNSPIIYNRRWLSGSTWGSWTQLLPANCNASLAVNPGSIAANSVYELTSTNAVFSTIKFSDAVIAVPEGALEAGLVWSCWAHGNGGIKLRIANPTGAAIVAASRTWRFVGLATI